MKKKTESEEKNHSFEKRSVRNGCHVERVFETKIQKSEV